MSLSQIVLVPVIMVCALGGTVGMLKVIQKVAPNAGCSVEKAQECIQNHNQTPKK